VITSGGQELAASTTTVTHDGWHASWWLLALTVAIAIVGFGALIALNRAGRTREAGS